MGPRHQRFQPFIQNTPGLRPGPHYNELLSVDEIVGDRSGGRNVQNLNTRT